MGRSSFFDYYVNSTFNMSYSERVGQDFDINGEIEKLTELKISITIKESPSEWNPNLKYLKSWSVFDYMAIV